MVEMLVSGTVVLAMDQAAKRAVQRHAAERVIRCGPLFSIRHVMSRRSFYSGSAAPVALVAIWILALASVLILALSGSAFPGRYALGAIGAALGGAASNLFDILRHRSVRDFIDLGWWPVFNFADIAIIGGLAIAFLTR
jgi:signal peptidase II